MELRHLRYFLAVAESGTLSAAAERLHLAQPALTHSIKSLEDELGTRLFLRSRKGMELTETGRLFLSHAQTILQQMARAKSSILDAEENPHGSVSLAMPSSVCNAITVPLFEILRERYANIELSLHEGLTGDLLTHFKLGFSDILVDFDTEESAEMTAEPLIRETLYFIQKHSKGVPRTIRFSELVKHPLYLPRAAIDSMSRAVGRYTQTENLKLNILKGAPTMHGVIRLVQGGLGCSVMAWSSIYQLEGHTLSARKIVDPELHRTVYMVTDITRARSNATEKVVEAIRQAVRIAHTRGHWHGELLMPS